MNGPMPRILTLISALLLVVSASAQQSNPDAGFVAPSKKQPKVDTAPVEKSGGYDVGGVVAQAVKMKKPLELINPLAPSKYDQSDDISWDPDNPEKPKGIILFGLQW